MSDMSANRARLILVVEDEDMIGDLVESYLEDLGFSILRAADATEAIVALTSHDDISLVFSDVVMPGTMDGFGLARWIRGHYPRIRVLLTSGYWGGRPLDRDAPPLLPKPYSFDELERRLVGLLKHASSRDRLPTHSCPAPAERASFSKQSRGQAHR